MLQQVRSHGHAVFFSTPVLSIKEMILYHTYINSVSPVKTAQHNHKFLPFQLFGKMVSFCYSALCACGNHHFYWLKTCKMLVTLAQVDKVSWLPTILSLKWLCTYYSVHHYDTWQ